MKMTHLTFKGIFYSICALLLIFSSSCEDKNELVTFNLEAAHQLKYDTVPQQRFLDTIIDNEVFQQEYAGFSFANEKEFETNKTNSTKVDDVQNLGITITIDSAQAEFSKVKKLEIFFVGLGQPLLLFQKEVFEPGIFVLSADLGATNTEMLKAIQQTNYKLLVKTFLSAQNTEPIYMTVKMRFRVKAMPA
jgi:hypothetical protein